MTLFAQGRDAEAEACAREAMQLECVAPEEHAVCAVLRLLRGDLAGGFAEHEWRLQMDGVPRPSMPRERWDGRPLDGRSILLYGEQGLGDKLQFVRYVPSVIAGAAGRSCGCQKR